MSVQANRDMKEINFAQITFLLFIQQSVNRSMAQILTSIIRKFLIITISFTTILWFGGDLYRGSQSL